MAANGNGKKAGTAPAAPAGDSRKLSSEERKERNKRRSVLSSRVKDLEATIAKDEKRLAEIHALQADPDAYAKGHISPGLASEGKTLERLIPKLVEEWEALAAEMEAAGMAAPVGA